MKFTVSHIKLYLELKQQQQRKTESFLNVALCSTCCNPYLTLTFIRAFVDMLGPDDLLIWCSNNTVLFLSSVFAGS